MRARDHRYNLAECFERGWGVPRDHGEAVVWYTQAADHGSAAARALLKEAELTDMRSVVTMTKAPSGKGH